MQSFGDDEIYIYILLYAHIEVCVYILCIFVCVYIYFYNMCNYAPCELSVPLAVLLSDVSTIEIPHTFSLPR